MLFAVPFDVRVNQGGSQARGGELDQLGESPGADDILFLGAFQGESMRAFGAAQETRELKQNVFCSLLVGFASF